MGSFSGQLSCPDGGPDILGAVGSDGCSSTNGDLQIAEIDDAILGSQLFGRMRFHAGPVAESLLQLADPRVGRFQFGLGRCMFLACAPVRLLFFSEVLLGRFSFCLFSLEVSKSLR